ncbi:MAG: phosphoribosylanthranilate isomerase [Oscillospiraceae bacterium]|nr:phosphoribosylanthranilate isomerase [Oscillospiraceae bacterium]
MKIKICGLFRTEDIEYANTIKPDYIGFVFAKSKRQVTSEQAYNLKQMLDKNIKSVGVFVNADIHFISELAKKEIIDVIQLHGNENNIYISELRKHTGDIPIIKAVSVKTNEDVIKADNYISDFVLLDNGKGGTGEKFDWNLIEESIKNKMFLAGGININNIKDAVKINPYCIDVSSGAETDGIKDKNKMIQLVEAVRNNGGIF